MTAGYFIGSERELLQLSDNKQNNICWTLVYIKGGYGIYSLDGALKPLNAGDVLVLPPRVDFSFRTEDLGDEYNVNLSAALLKFDSGWLKNILEAFPTAGEMVLAIKELKNPLMVTGPKWIRMSSLLDGILSSDKHELPVRLFEILALLADRKDLVLIKSVGEYNSPEVSRRKERIDNYIECNCCDKISLDDISRYVGMSRTYFCIFFKAQYGKGFADYLNRKRVEKASLLLAGTDKPIPAIALECGFKTVQYFTKAFKKVTGTTPGVYRKQK